MRHYRDMPTEARKMKKDLLAKPGVEKADEQVLSEFAALADRLGFESDEIRALKQRSSDREIARNALLKARKPNRYQYEETTLEAHITQIVNLFTTATPLPRESASPHLVSDNPDASGNRCGLPDEDAQQQDSKFLFMPRLHKESEELGEDVTSYFVRRSVYMAFFGKTANLGTDTGSNVPLRTTSAENPEGSSTYQEPEMDGLQWMGQHRQEPSETRQGEAAMREQERREQECREQERREQERREQERREQDRLGREQLEQERLEQVRQLQKRLEQERLEQVRLAAGRLEQARQEQEHLERERQEQERQEQERREQERREQERQEQERREQERQEQERQEQERQEQERQEQERQEPAQPEQGLQAQGNPRGAQKRNTQIDMHRVITRAGKIDHEVPAAQDDGQAPGDVLGVDGTASSPNLQAANQPAGPAGGSDRANTAEASQRSDSTPSTEQGAQPPDILRITYYVWERGAWRIPHTLDMGSTDASEVERVAIKYMRKGFRLFDKDLNILTPRNCLEAATLDGSNTILLVREADINIDKTLESSVSELPSTQVSTSEESPKKRGRRGTRRA